MLHNCEESYKEDNRMVTIACVSETRAIACLQHPFFIREMTVTIILIHRYRTTCSYKVLDFICWK